MKVQFYVDHRVVGAILQQPKPYYATMSSHWANTHGGHAVRPQVALATPLHPYKPLGFLARPLPHRC